MKGCNSTFYTKTYARFIEDSENVKVNYFKFCDGENFAYFPFVLQNETLSSLRYGGIYTNCKKADFSKQVQGFFEEYCKKNNIKNVLIRENPFIKTVKIGKVVEREPFVYIDLSKSSHRLKNEISRRHAECIQAAMKQKLILCEVKDLKYLEIFYKFYKDVLSRKGVEPQKFSYFAKLFSCLKHSLQIVCVKHNRVVIAVSIILKSGGNAFMLYGGMSEFGYKRGAKHFMIHSLISEYKARGYKRLVLGTGHNAKDSIYRFKRGFTERDSYIHTYEYWV